MNTAGRGLFAGLLYAFAVMTILVVLFSLFLLWTNMREESLGMYSVVIHVIALLTGGFIAGKRSGSKGWLNGGILGILYGILVLMTGFLAFDAGLGTTKLMLLAGAFLTGAVGGMFGVQFKR